MGRPRRGTAAHPAQRSEECFDRKPVNDPPTGLVGGEGRGTEDSEGNATTSASPRFGRGNRPCDAQGLF